MSYNPIKMDMKEFKQIYKRLKEKQMAKKVKMPKGYEKEERRHDKVEEAEEKRHEKKHDVAMKKALKKMKVRKPRS